MDKLILLSGGIDSAAAAIVSGASRALFINYGQPAASEEHGAARDVAGQLGIPLTWASVSSARCEPDEKGVYPARNMMLISLAAMNGAKEIIIGCTAADGPMFADCRPDYLYNLGRLLQPFGVFVTVPLAHKTRAEAVEIAKGITGTWSCYTAGPEPCGECLSCTQ